MSRFRRAGRARRGAVAVEFALAAPVFLLILYGVVEFGRAMWAWNTLEYAVAEATRYAMVNADVSAVQIRTKAQESAPGLALADSDLTVTIETDLDGNRTFVTVEGNHVFSLIIPIVPIGPFNLSTKSRSPVVR